MESVIHRLLRSVEPSIRYKVRVHVLGEAPDSPAIRQLQEEIRVSPRVKALLSERGRDGRIPFHPYAKFYGAHWILAALADLGYPPGDETLLPLRDQALNWIASQEYETRLIRRRKTGPVRIHGSLDGNAILAILTLGLGDPRLDIPIGHLLDYQWPDGGWNCDIKAKGATSSFDESWIPLRALALHARLTGNRDSRKAVEKAAEIFLSRRLCWRRSDGTLIKQSYAKLHYPYYWHYNLLSSLRVMAETGFIGDGRCKDALDLLESKRLPGGGYPAEKAYYRATTKMVPSGRSLVNWGGVSGRRLNEWVTAEALAVMKAARRQVA
jgi:ADP-ribose pyrophosphatase YjhB (NUDIX family)